MRQNGKTVTLLAMKCTTAVAYCSTSHQFPSVRLH